MTIHGKVFTGEGKASEFLSLRPYREFLEEVLGDEVFPGTLNLEAEVESIEELKKEAADERLESFEFEGEEYGGITVYAVEVEEVEAVLLEIDRTHYGEDVAEIAAPENLRQQLSLEEGDKVEVVPRKEF